MLRMLIGSVMLAGAMAGAAAAQPPQGGPASRAEAIDQLPPISQATPDMWYYVQELRRYDDPQQAVRRAAEFRASQRRARIAALSWYGFSNARPQASVTPFMGTYGPTWVGSSGNPYHWLGGGYPHAAMQVETGSYNGY